VLVTDRELVACDLQAGVFRFPLLTRGNSAPSKGSGTLRGRVLGWGAGIKNKRDFVIENCWNIGPMQRHLQAIQYPTESSEPKANTIRHSKSNRITRTLYDNNFTTSKSGSKKA
jgi:hypothetical protein